MTELSVVTERQTASNALATINPTEYVEAVYSTYLQRVERAKVRVKDVKYDITTTIGMGEAKEYRALFRDIRIEAEKERKARKEPLLIIGKLLDNANAEIERSVSEYEDRFDSDIKAEEKRKEDEKAEKLRLEEQAKAVISNKIDAIKNKPLQLIGASSDHIEIAIANIKALTPTSEEYGERFVEAEYAIKDALVALDSLLAGRIAQDVAQLQQKELERQQALAKAEDVRVKAIESKIQSIKNFIIDSSECNYSYEVNILLAKLSKVYITEEDFGEYYNDALLAESKVKAVLTRQFETLRNTEYLEQQKLHLTQEKAEAEANYAPSAEFQTQAQPQVTVDIKPEIVEVSPAQVVIDHQPEISAFFKSRDFKKAKENEYRAVIVEYLKFASEFNSK